MSEIYNFNPHLCIVVGAFSIYLFVGAILKIIKATRNYGHKIKDEPISGLHCKFCGKHQDQCSKYDSDCPHQWQED